jgi:hypothetical protein
MARVQSYTDVKIAELIAKTKADLEAVIAGATFVTLGPSDPIPAGTPAGSIILRTV